MDTAKDFHDLAVAYCRFISENEITEASVAPLTELLMRLYVSASNQPDAQPETIDRLATGDAERPAVRIGDQIPRIYWEVFDPLEKDEPVCGDLADDLSDIAADLAIGIEEYEAGRIGNAIHEWKFGLRNHWGSHVVDALRVLHAVASR